MFNTDSVVVKSGVKPGINVNVEVESVYAPLKKDGTGDSVLQIKVVNTSVKKVFWAPKQAGNTSNRACPYNFEFNGVKGQMGVEMTDEVANALELYDFVRTTKQVLLASGFEGAVEGSTYDDFCKNFVKVAPKFRADVKIVYGTSGYLEFAKSGFIAVANSGKLTITDKDVLTKEPLPTDLVSGKSDDLPF